MSRGPQKYDQTQETVTACEGSFNSSALAGVKKNIDVPGEDPASVWMQTIS